MNTTGPSSKAQQPPRGTATPIPIGTPLPTPIGKPMTIPAPHGMRLIDVRIRLHDNVPMPRVEKWQGFARSFEGSQWETWRRTLVDVDRDNRGAVVKLAGVSDEGAQEIVMLHATRLPGFELGGRADLDVSVAHSEELR